MEREDLLAMLDDHYVRVAAPRAAPRVLVMDVLNPGTSRPEDQGHPAISLDQAQSSSISSNSINNSDGQVQRIDIHPGRQGVTATMVPMLSTKLASDGQFQRKDLSPTNQGVGTSIGHAPAKDISVAAQNFHRAPLAIASVRPPSLDLDGSKIKPGGGLPRQVNIK